MADEQIDIKITDGVDPKIAKGIEAIAKAALGANKSVKTLQQSINKLNINKLNKVASATKNVTTAKNKFTIASDKQRIAQERLALKQQDAILKSKKHALAVDKHKLALKRLETQQNRTTSATTKFTKTIASTRNAIISFFVLFRSVRAVVQLEEDLGNLQNRLRNVTTGSAELASAMKDVFDSANRSRAPVLEVATAFQRFSLAFDDLGRSQSSALRLTETLSKAVAISGLTAQEATSGIRQITQAFNKGKLDGDEFRSVMENIPIVARAIAKEMGVATGALVALAPQGKITAEIIANAMASAADEIDEKFGRINLTVSQSTSLFGNAFLQLKKNFDESTGAASVFADTIKFMADNLTTIASAITGLLVAGGIASLPALVTALGSSTVAMTAFNAVLAVNPLILLAAAIAGVVVSLTLFEKKTDDIVDQAGSLGKDTAKKFKDEFGKEFADFSPSAMIASANDPLQTTPFFPRTTPEESQRAVSGVITAEDTDKVNEFAGAVAKLQVKLSELPASAMTSLEKQAADLDNFRSSVALITEESAQAIADLRALGDLHGDAEVLKQEKITEAAQAGIEARQALRDAERAVALAAGRSIAESLTSIAKDAAGEQSSVFKAMFAVSKAFAVAESIIKIQQALANAAASGPFPANLGAIAVVAAETASIVSNINAVKFAAGGMVRGLGGPRDDKIDAKLSSGEFVVNAAATSSNRMLLEAINAGQDVSGGVGMNTVPTLTRTPGAHGTQGVQPQVNVNVFTLRGTTAEVRSSQNNDTTDIEVIIKQVDDKLALNLRQNTGSLTQELSRKDRQGF